MDAAMTNTEKRIEVASKVLGKAAAKLAKLDPEIAARITAVLADEMQRIRDGR